MRIIKLYLMILTLPVAVSSCTKVIDIKTDNGSGKLDIEANVVDTAGVQTIKISKNVPFTATNIYPPVTGATVTVTDAAGRNFIFAEDTAGTYINRQLTGTVGNAYKMTVVTSGTTYTANSTIPDKVELDSVISKNQFVSSGSNPKKEISVYYQDPAGIANYYRFILFVNGVQVKDVFAFNDEFNDGKAVGIILRQRDIDIYAGDNIRVIMECIDPSVYLYWFTLSQQGDNGPGGSVTPADPPTNITPVSLGYFSAHTTQTRSIIAN